MENFSERFAYLLNNYADIPMKVSDLAEKLNYSKNDASKLYQYQSGHSEPKTENLRQLKKVFPLLNLDWLIAGAGEFKEIDPNYVRELEEKFKEAEEERKMFKKMALVNFPNVYTSSQSVDNSLLVDNIDELDELDVVTRNAFLGQSFYSDLIGEA